MRRYNYDLNSFISLLSCRSNNSIYTTSNLGKGAIITHVLPLFIVTFF